MELNGDEYIIVHTPSLKNITQVVDIAHEQGYRMSFENTDTDKNYVRQKWENNYKKKTCLLLKTKVERQLAGSSTLYKCLQYSNREFFETNEMFNQVPILTVNQFLEVIKPIDSLVDELDEKILAMERRLQNDIYQ